MSSSPVLKIRPLGFPWETVDPFLFCVHHDDLYPKGNEKLGPDASLEGRQIGSDFAGKDGWRMYHGEAIPGFPSHPHRGFETVTVIRKGFIDHSDSLGATARFSDGDVQWLTAGRGIMHSEMFPLLDSTRPNPLDFFQIWLNLPARSKMAEPHFTMFWADRIPRHTFTDDNGFVTTVTCTAGRIPGADDDAPLAPPPASWAAHSDSDVAIWTLTMAPGASWTLPAADGPGTRRTLYFYKGKSVSLEGQVVDQGVSVELRAGQSVALQNGHEASEFLLLQGRPIGEPVAQYGPFVTNTEEELKQAFADYRRTEFGGWPWADNAPVHGPDRARFARHANGRIETLEAHPAAPTQG